jgi:hypothetical protein
MLHVTSTTLVGCANTSCIKVGKTPVGLKSETFFFLCIPGRRWPFSFTINCVLACVALRVPALVSVEGCNNNRVQENRFQEHGVECFIAV